jgi:hypothetical protein
VAACGLLSDGAIRDTPVIGFTFPFCSAAAAGMIIFIR